MPNPLVACVFVILSLCFVPTARAGEPPAKPLNILWLTVEDMSPWLGCYGDKTAPTPNVDRLAREGIRYTNAFATSPVCAPSRHTLITGMYASQTGALHMRNGSQSKEVLGVNPRAYDEIPLYEAVPPPEVRCFSEILRAAGFYATNNVKQDYQFRAPVTAWDESSRRAHYENRVDGQPFFAVFNCTWTHESQGFPNAERRSNVVKPANVPIPPYYPDTYEVRQALAQTYNNIVAMDGWVGQKLDELEKAGLLDSTIIFFFSDHGVGLPRGKRNCYDSGLRVPLIVRFPDQRRAGETDDRLVSFLDFAPTVLSLVNIRPPAYMKGHPFLGAFKTDPPQYVFATQDRMDATQDTVRTASDGRYRYIRNLMPEVPHLPRTAYRENLTMMRDLHKLKESGEAIPQQWQVVSKEKPKEEFYDSQADPHNVFNLIDAPEHQERIKKMRAALTDWMADIDDMGLILPESKLVREKLWPPDGQQPRTATPYATIRGGTLTIECETPGASIGYRKRGEPSWKVYTAPTEVDPAAAYEIIAHRIGYRPSATVELAQSR